MTSDEILSRPLSRFGHDVYVPCSHSDYDCVSGTFRHLATRCVLSAEGIFNASFRPPRVPIDAVAGGRKDALPASVA
jgi:hypothetical protein